MKISNIKFTATAYFENGKIKSRFFVTEKAMSNWANRQYEKDENVTVEVFDGFGFDQRYCTYHA